MKVRKVNSYWKEVVNLLIFNDKFHCFYFCKTNQEGWVPGSTLPRKINNKFDCKGFSAYSFFHRVLWFSTEYAFFHSDSSMFHASHFWTLADQMFKLQSGKQCLCRYLLPSSLNKFCPTNLDFSGSMAVSTDVKITGLADPVGGRINVFINNGQVFNFILHGGIL